MENYDKHETKFKKRVKHENKITEEKFDKID